MKTEHCSDIVYILSYPKGFCLPTGEDLAGIVFYVGKGLPNRIMAHEKEATTSCSCEKCQVIRSIWDVKLMVQRDIVAKDLTPAQSTELERECLLVRFSGPYLVNKQHNRHRASSAQSSATQKGVPIMVSGETYRRLFKLIEKTGLSPDRVLQEGIRKCNGDRIASQRMSG